MTNPARWQRMHDIVQSAAGLDQAARAAFLARACLGDGTLESDCVQLLTAHDVAGPFIDSPVVRSTLSWDAPPETSDPPAERQREALEGGQISHYEIERKLGAGGMGVVYAARDRALGRRAALKVLPATFTAELRRRLLAEAETCSNLQHPAIATFYESGEADGLAFIAMELVEGKTLRARLRRGALPAAEAVMACVLEALSHAHAAGILHRDIKPENVMVAGPGSAKLLDFGIARRMLFEESDATALVDVGGAGRLPWRRTRRPTPPRALSPEPCAYLHHTPGSP